MLTISSRRSSLLLGIGLIAGLGLVAAHPAAAQTIGNAGFESPSLGSGSYAYSASYADPAVPQFTADQAAQTVWNFQDSSGITGNGSGFTSGNADAPEGTQAAFLQNGGSFSQTISGFTDGTYSFSFDAAQRGNYGGPQTVQVSLDGATLGVFSPLSTDYTTFTTDFAPVTGSTHTLTFTGLNTDGDNTAFVDNVGVSLAPVPEASTTVSLGLLLALGLGGLAVAKKRKSALSA